jgi:hypothetical protein
MRLVPFNITEKIKIEKTEQNLFDECFVTEDSFIIRKKCSDEMELHQIWKSSVDFVAGNIQAQLEILGLSEMLAWNIYLIFDVKNKVSKELKNQIESDKFCCKKYVIASNINESFEDSIGRVIPLFGSIDNDDRSIAEGIPDETGILNQVLAQAAIDPNVTKIIQTTPELASLTDDNSEGMKNHLSKLLKSINTEVANG